MRRGVSLAELLVVMIVMSVAAGALGRVAVQQQRRYRDLSAGTEARAQVRHAIAVLTSELRGISSAGGDIYPGEMLDASIAFRSAIGSFIVCSRRPAAASDTHVASLDAAFGGGFGSDLPEVGDSLLIYDSGAPLEAWAEAWNTHVVTASAPAAGTCLVSADGSPLLPASVRVQRLSLQPAPPARLRAGAPLRAFRRVRYALYESSDGWHLGFADCRPLVRAPACATIQPVSGPYNRYAVAGGSRPSGLTLSYFDAAGRPTPDERAVSRIDVAVAAPGLFGGRSISMDASVGLRNGRR